MEKQFLNDLKMRNKIGRTACVFVRNNFAWKNIALHFEKVCAETIKKYCDNDI